MRDDVQGFLGKLSTGTDVRALALDSAIAAVAAGLPISSADFAALTDEGGWPQIPTLIGLKRIAEPALASTAGETFVVADRERLERFFLSRKGVIVAASGASSSGSAEPDLDHCGVIERNLPRVEAVGAATVAMPGMICIAPADTRIANGATLVILPGGGYRKVCMGKEGRAVATYFATQLGCCCFVIDYQLAGSIGHPRHDSAVPAMRAPTIAPSLADAETALAFVRRHTQASAVLAPERLVLMGFSAGACATIRPLTCSCVVWSLVHHNSLQWHCLLLYCIFKGTHTHTCWITFIYMRNPGGHLAMSLLVAERRREQEAAATTTAVQRKPPAKVAALVLVYPTIRNPCCWCIVGGLWVGPACVGHGWAAAGEHRYCWQESSRMLDELLPALPAAVCAVTTAGDLLLPMEKHSGALIAAMRSATAVAATAAGESSTGAFPYNP